MISEASRADFIAEDREATASTRISRVLSVSIYLMLLAIVSLSVVPYGGAEGWSKALLSCALFAVSALCFIEIYLSDTWRIAGSKLLLPLMALALFAWVQTISLTTKTVAAVQVGTTISVDPHATRFFAIQFVSLILLAGMLYRYATTLLRLRSLINVIIVVAAVSACFGILRQTTQHTLGFGLPLLAPDQGYGQFINRNHFAFLMEIGFGITLGVIVGGGVSRDRGLLYLAALIPIWTGLVLSNSRGGILSMLTQIASAALLFGAVKLPNERESWSMRITRSLPARLALLIVLVLAVVAGTFWLGSDRLAARLGPDDQEQSVAAIRQNARRNEIWVATLKLFAAHPIAGVGMGAYWAAIPEYHNASGTLTPQEAHNDYLELLASGGSIGFGLGVWFFVMLIRRVRKGLQTRSRFRRAVVLGATLSLVGVAVHSLVDFGLHMFGNAILFTAIIVLATPPALKTENS